MSLEDQENWSVECSDEEGYFDRAVNYRILPAGGGRIWEPSGGDIARLYGEMETVGFNKLQWQCPGRISPSQLQTESIDGQFENKEDSDSLTTGSQTKSKFDFDNEFDDEESGNPPSLIGSSSGNKVTAKRTQSMFLFFVLFIVFNNLFFTVVKKSQTNLSKVMLNIKKYQMIDQKGGKSNASSTSTSNSSTAPVSNTISSFPSTTTNAVNNGTTTTTTTAESVYDEFE